MMELQVLNNVAGRIEWDADAAKSAITAVIAPYRDLVVTEILKWEILPLDMKVKDFTEAQIKIAERADSAITSAAGLHPSLANILVAGKLASGSEMLYAYKLFIATETQIFQSKALKMMNLWKKLRFPNIPGQFGFYHDIVKREEDITASERTTNNEQ